jgi:nitrite reductase/ring-hydroxylating ferredoxin subunit
MKEETDRTIDGQWTDVAASDALTADGAIEVLAEGRIVAIFRDRDQLFAMDGMCAHQGGPICQGTVADGCVTCPWHGWQYELATGIQTVNRKPLQETFAVRIRDDRIQIQLPRT